MSEYYKLLPEVSGQLGHKTIMNTSLNPPKVDYLHFVFDGWLGDDLIESFPCYLITEKLLSRLKQEQLTGFETKDAEIDYSDLFRELYPEKKMPTFRWLTITGNKNDDFFLFNNYLTVTDKALKLLQEENINNCDIEKITI